MGRHIYVYSPSGAVRDRAALRRGVRRLQALGHEVELDPSALDSVERFAGDDTTRLAALGRAAASGADVAMITRGGYGLTRLLADLPYKALARAIERGTDFVGLSDFTALQIALLARTGAPTWAGPAVCEAFGTAEPEPDDIMLACFEDFISGQGEGTGWRQPKPRANDPSLALARHGRWLSEDARWGVGHATLWGGNLSVLCALLGTPYFPDIERGILFLEDVGEHPYRIERMLTQLLHAGVLQKQKAIVLGQFTDFRLTPHDRGYGLGSVWRWLRRELKVPVVQGLPFGHVPTKVMLPVGACCDLAVDGRDVLLLWGHDHDHASAGPRADSPRNGSTH